MEKIKSPVFLVYLNRSGSTFLAGKLCQHRQIGSTPECEFNDGIYKPLLKIKNITELNNYLSKLYKDDRFISWNINKELLKQDLLQYSFPITFNQVFDSCMNLYFSSMNVSTKIYKSPHIFYIEKIRGIIPEARFIFIIRDIRAIYNSQKNTRDTDFNRIMAPDPIKPSLYFNLAKKVVKKYKSQSWFYFLKYEDLICDTKTEINKVLRFLNEEEFKELPNDTDYIDSLSEKQKTIHPNLTSNPLEERINAWKNSLSEKEVFILESHSSNAMEYFGYSKSKLKLSIFAKLSAIMFYWLKYLSNYVGKYTYLRAILKGTY